MPAKRPTSVLVIAIFAFIFGGLGLIWELVQLGTGVILLNQPKAVAPPANAPASMAGAFQTIDANAPFWREANLIASLVGLLLSVVLIVDGIGLLLYQPWARIMAMGYAVLSILFQASWMLYSVLCVLPVQFAYYDAASAPAGAGAAQAQGFQTGARIGASCAAFGGLVTMIYPVAVLIVMLLPAVAAAFRGEPTADEDERDRYDRGERRGDDYGRPLPGYGGEPDDRIGPGRH